MASSVAFANVVNNTSPTKLKTDEALVFTKDLEKKIQVQAIQRRIRVREFFLDFDRLRKGTVTSGNFRTCLSMLGLNFSEEEIQALLLKYSTPDKLFRYRDFYNNVDAVLTDDVLRATSVKEMTSSAMFTHHELQVFKETLEIIRSKVKANRIMFKEMFQDFDRTRTCHVTRDQFARVLTQLGLAPSETSLELICRKYLDKGNTKEVNYLKFLSDVETANSVEPSISNSSSGNSMSMRDSAQSNPVRFSSSVIIENKVPKNVDASDVENRIQAEVVMKRIRVNEFFRDFDKLRKGIVKENHFHTVLGMLNLRLTEGELNALYQKYACDRGFRYVDFCEQIDSVFTTKGIEKTPGARVKQLSSVDTLAARRRFLNFNDDEKECLQDCLERGRKFILTRRVLLKPLFADFDVTRSGHVTRNQFLRVLTQLGFSMASDEVEVILKRYLDKGNSEEVNYVDFCSDVDKPEVIFQVEKSAARTVDLKDLRAEPVAKQTLVNDTPDDIQDLLSKLRRIAREKRVRFAEFLRDFDKLRSGNITVNQFRTGLNMAGVILSTAEFELLVDNYPSTNKAGHIRWRQFCDNIEEVFTVKELEKNPDLTPTDNLTMSYGRTRQNYGEKSLAKQVIERFAVFVQKHRLNAKPSFQDWDRHNRFKVSPKQFRQVLASLNFEMSDQEYTEITKLYQSDDGTEVKYLNFLRETSAHDGAFIKNQGVATTVKEATKITDGTRHRNLGIEELMERIKHQVKQRRLRPLEFFVDYDPLRKGTIPKSKFRGALDLLKLGLTSEELDRLENYFQSEQDWTRVSYARFNEITETVFTVKGLEKNPTFQVTDFKAPSYLDPQDVINDAEEEELDVVLKALGYKIYKFHILLKPFFQDKDRSKCGKVACSRFRSIMDLLKLPLTDRDYTLICKRFSAGGGTEFNYVDFDNVMKHYSGDADM